MKKLPLILLGLMFVWTCGGGGGGDTPTEPGPSGPGSPSVQDIQVTTNEDVSSVITLNGTDPGNLPLTFSVSAQPANGSFSLSGNTGTYTPNENFNGSDEFTFFASNGTNNSNTGKVVIAINPVNDDPTSIDVSVTTDEDNNITFELQANEYDGDTIVFQIDEQVTNGQLTLSGSSATYIPNQNWFGVDTFKFSVYDSTGKSMLKSGNGTIVVNALNDPPSVNDIYDVVVKSGQVEPIKLNAYDVDSYSVSYQVVDDPSNGHVFVSNDTAYFSPIRIGFDSFTFEAYDGLNYSEPGSVFLEIQNNGSGQGVQINTTYENHNYFNGLHSASTLLNNGNILIAVTLYSNPCPEPRTTRNASCDDPAYLPIHLIEITEDGQVIDRKILDNFSNDFSDVMAIQQLSNNNIILLSSNISKENGRKTFASLLSSDYSILIENLSSIPLYLGGTSITSFTYFDGEFVELSNGNILFKNIIFDSNLDVVTTDDSFTDNRKVYENNILYGYCVDAISNKNSICSYDDNGIQLNQISFDQNVNLNGGPLFKTSYGFLLSSNYLIRFDNNFNVLSVGTSGTMNQVKYQNENGFISIFSNRQASGIELKKYDEYGNLYFSNTFYAHNVASILKNNRDNFMLIIGPKFGINSGNYSSRITGNIVDNFEYFDDDWFAANQEYLHLNYYYYSGYDYYNYLQNDILIQTITNNGNRLY
jgi:hypothetical protein